MAYICTMSLYIFCTNIDLNGHSFQMFPPAMTRNRHTVVQLLKFPLTSQKLIQKNKILLQTQYCHMMHNHIHKYIWFNSLCPGLQSTTNPYMYKECWYYSQLTCTHVTIDQLALVLHVLTYVLHSDKQLYCDKKELLP